MIQITQTTLQPALQAPANANIQLRGWYTNSFVAADGVTPVQGGNGQTGFFYGITCSVNGDGFVVIPAFDVQETTESNPTAGFFGQLFIDGSPRQVVFGYPQATAGWAIPSVYGPVVSYDQIARYNAAIQLLWASPSFFTQTQTIAEINRIAGELSYAGVGVLGRTELSTAPDDPAHPIALSATDTSVGDLHGSLTTNRTPRASATKTLVDGLPTDDGTDWGIQTLNYIQLGDYGNVAGGTKLAVNDTFNLVRLLAGSSAGAQYAGIVGDCSGVATVTVQATGYSYLKNTSAGVVALGDGANAHNGTRIVIDDVAELIKLLNVPTADPTVAGAIWNSSGTLKISAG